MTINVGVIGAGIMGADHARILHRDVPGCRVTMLADIDPDRAAQLAADIPTATVTGDALALVEAADVDAILIASSDAMHFEQVMACLQVGKPVLCEKPLAPTAAECAELAAAERAIIGDGAPLVSVGFMRRFDPGYVQLKALLASGELGAPLLVHSIGRGVGAPAGTNELTVTGSAIHDIDIVPWLLDSPVAEVQWVAPRQSPEVADRQDPQFILMRTANDVLIPVEIFLNAKYGYDIRCEVVGSLGSANLTEPTRVSRDAALSHGYAYAGDWRPRFADAYRLQNRAWIESLTSTTPTPLATAEDGRQAALVADAVIASMHAGGGWVVVRDHP